MGFNLSFPNCRPGQSLRSNTQLPKWLDTKLGRVCSKTLASGSQWGLMGHDALNVEAGVETQALHGTVKLRPLQLDGTDMDSSKGLLPAYRMSSGVIIMH